MSHDTKLNLAQRLHAVMREAKYVQKDTEAGAGKSVKGVARDAVVAKVRGILLQHGVIATTSQVGPGRNIETAAKSSGGTPLCIYVGMYATTFINVDNPAETHVVCHEGQGNDYGDKAPGKAATYGEKLNFVKGLMLETGIEDEGRNKGEGEQVEDEAPKVSQDEIDAVIAEFATIGTFVNLNAYAKAERKRLSEKGAVKAQVTMITEAASKRAGEIKEEQAKEKGDAQ